MVAVPLIATSLVTGVMGLGHADRLGKMFARTLMYYIATSMLAIVTGLALVNLIRPGLGVSLVPDTVARRWGIKGLIIAKVVRGGSAERAGLRGVRETGPGRIEIGDILVAVEGKPVETVDDLMDAMEKHKVGDRVKVDVIRNKKRQSVDVTLQAVN